MNNSKKSKFILQPNSLDSVLDNIGTRRIVTKKRWFSWADVITNGTTREENAASK